MKKSVVFLLFGLGIFSFSCNNDLEGFSGANTEVQGKSVITRSATDVMKIVYHGKVYETKFIIDGDSCFYTNSDFNSIVSNLDAEGNDIVTFLHANGTMELFDNQSDFSLNKERLMAEHKEEKRAVFMQSDFRGIFPEDNKPYLSPADPENNEVEIHMYEDEFYWGDWTLLKRTKKDSDYQQVAKEWNYGGEATSMIAHTIGVGAWFTFFERMGCQGKSFAMIVGLDARIDMVSSASYASSGDGGNIEAVPNQPRYGSLFGLDLRGFHAIGISGDWNDRIHSIRVERYIGGGGVM